MSDQGTEDIYHWLEEMYAVMEKKVSPNMAMNTKVVLKKTILSYRGELVSLWRCNSKFLQQLDQAGNKRVTAI